MSWIMFIAHLHQRLRLYTIRWMNLNVIVHLHVMHLVRNVQLILPEIIIVHDIYCFDWSTSESARTCWGHRHIIWHSDLHEQLDMKKLSARWVPRLLTVVISMTMWRFQNNVWRCFNIIQMNFCVDSLLWTKCGSITSHPRRRKLK